MVIQYNLSDDLSVSFQANQEADTPLAKKLATFFGQVVDQALAASAAKAANAPCTCVYPGQSLTKDQIDKFAYAVKPDHAGASDGDTGDTENVGCQAKGEGQLGQLGHYVKQPSDALTAGKSCDKAPASDAMTIARIFNDLAVSYHNLGKLFLAKELEGEARKAERDAKVKLQQIAAETAAKQRAQDAVDGVWVMQALRQISTTGDVLERAAAVQLLTTLEARDVRVASGN